MFGQVVGERAQGRVGLAAASNGTGKVFVKGGDGRPGGPRREILGASVTTTPQGQAADAAFVKWLTDHQKEAGLFKTVSTLVDQFSPTSAIRGGVKA